MSDIYCGVGKVPKGKKVGSMIQCAEKKQIRYYGIKKIDQRIIDNIVLHNNKNSDRRQKIISKMMKTSGKIKKLERKIMAEKDVESKNKLKKELTTLKEQLSETRKELKVIEDKRKLSRSKKSSKKSSRKSSKRSLKRSKKSSRK